MTEGSDRGGLGKTMETILGVKGWEKAKKLFLKKESNKRGFYKKKIYIYIYIYIKIREVLVRNS